MEVIREADKNFTGMLEYFGEETTTQASDFFAMIDQFMEAFDKALDLVEKEERTKMMEVQRQLAKEAKLTSVRVSDDESDTSNSKELSARKCRPISDAGQSNNSAAQNNGDIGAMGAATAQARCRQSGSPARDPLQPFEMKYQSLNITATRKQKTKERQQMTWDEEKWAKRSDRLAIQINVDQERVEIQVNNIHQPKPGRLAAKEAKHEAAGQVGHTNTDCH